MTDIQTSYQPQSGSLQLEELDGSLTIAIKIVFAELMNPDDPNCTTNVWAEIEAIPMPVDNWRNLPGQEVDMTSLIEDGEIDAGIVDRGLTDFLWPFKVSFGELNGRQIIATIVGELDREDAVEFSWNVPLEVDPEALDTACREHLTNQ